MSSQPGNDYRSLDLPKGYFSRIGSMHMHIDGGGNADLVTAALRELESSGARGKINIVMDSIPGPQRQDYPDTYASHTPVLETQEVLDYFSTTHLANRDQAIKALSRILPLLSDHPAIVVEVEHVVAKIDRTGHWSAVCVDRVLPIESGEVGFERAATLPYEVHMCVDISGTTPTLSLRQLLQESAELGVRVGGWFTFMKEDVCAYRSNAFSTADDFEEYARTNHELLDRFLKNRGIDYQLWTLIERVIGVWRTPVQPV